MLKMSSGLDWDENYEIDGQVPVMLFTRQDMAAFAAKSKLTSQPGAKWYYSSGDSLLLARWLRSTFDSDEAYWSFAHTHLFNALGMTQRSYAEADASGTFVGSSYVYLTARDWGKFGQLYLQDGMWNGVRVLPEGWVAYTREAAADSRGGYGAHWWLAPSTPGVPTDTYFCSGHEGQYTHVIPSEDLVVVR
eukprot:CAMPEP_0205833522 /NCGR_PEP_ID=MMETSP0206-20130828/49964_1 /ASSEMBLY_ACC=CAM_ASM_000279 /TAXON_ID=36767 /ORGANISM="Euplotes focardii, Strain TN1" /LENGTH=190 /DNA_ID=CAMNT_0053140011 /DNA_START=1 /DNA_END=569 /DNA_ORIENTATION=-